MDTYTPYSVHTHTYGLRLSAVYVLLHRGMQAGVRPTGNLWGWRMKGGHKSQEVGDK